MARDKTRRDLVRQKLLEGLPKGGVVAEIGVWEGAFSERILEICAPRELHLIDPWLYMPEFPNTGFGRRKNADLMESRYESVVAKFADRPEVRIHRATSQDALPLLPDGTFDWVYIDGNHNEPFISTDLRLCLSKVKPNGIIAGDDFNWQSERSGAPVRAAVEALLRDLGDAAHLDLMANQYRIALSRGAD